METNKITWEQSVLWLREQPEYNDLVKACYFDDPLLDSAERFYHSIEWDATRVMLQKIKKGLALEIGAGRGIASYAMAKDGWQVTALEPDKSLLVGSGAIKKLSDESGIKITVIENWGETLPFGENSFDLVYVRQVMHHASSMEKFCSEIFRVLKKGGLFLATREHVISRREHLQVFLDSHPLHRFYGGENAYLLNEYTGAIKKAGFKIKRILKPFDSDINQFPCSINSFKPGKDILNLRFKLRLAKLNLICDTPGRLYSFMCIK
jgi:ubiquinone/menaquinone biosynthesis C-methylase UbiE